MLTPEYLLQISEGGEAIAEELHDEIIKQIVERIAIRLDRGDNYILTARDKWQIEVLQDAGYLREDIEKEIARRVKLMQKEIAQAMEDAGVKSMEYDEAIYRAAGLSPQPLEQSPHLIRLMQRAYEATMGEWVNFTRTTADASQKAFIRACDKAYTMVSSGAMAYGQAYVDAINDIVADGVTVTYPSGHADTIETATLRCIRTGVSQATAQITDARMEEMDWDIILVSSHLGARVTDREDFTNHYWWQGKFYSRSGKDTRFPPYSVCNEGHVQGIHGANCRHSHGPGDGEFNPFEHYDSEENRKEYELQQRQRAMERRIRDSKRKCMGLKHGVDSATTPEGKALAETEYQKQAALLQKRNKAYNDFCEENGLKRKSERITIAKWDREQAAKARAAAKQYGKRYNTDQIFSPNTKYKESGGVFNLEAAKKDYSEFLTTVPEKNKIWLQQSFENVEYQETHLEDSPFGFSPSHDLIFYDPSREDFWQIDFTTANTHELAHRIDTFFVGSNDVKAFRKAIRDAELVISEDPTRFQLYCERDNESMFLSDIFSAISIGKYEFPVGHSPEYWGKAGTREREIFANLFSIEALQDEVTIKFLEENFPDIVRIYIGIEFGVI